MICRFLVLTLVTHTNPGESRGHGHRALLHHQCPFKKSKNTIHVSFLTKISEKVENQSKTLQPPVRVPG